jgi:hypothetical protein
MIGITDAHKLGYHGEDVLIAIFDTGFILDHEALNDVQVLATWDFVNNDETVSNEPGDLSTQHNHGTEILGVLAGYQPGEFIGAAYASKFLLAKTEDLKSETHIEEDNWIAAVEWAERLGADIINSSLNYILDYSYEDMDGNTALITRAADMAFEKGMVVFNAAGNEGALPWKYISAPADGKYVIAMGGVRPDGSYWPTSSTGPTADGRIKPDLMSQGQSVYTINVGTQNGYYTRSGTSYSCALGTGAGAILLSAMYNLSPYQVRDILFRHASQFSTPNNTSGYGLIDLESVMLNVVRKPGVSVRDFQVQSGQGRNYISWISDREIENENWLIHRRSGSQELISLAVIQGRLNGVNRENYNYTDFDVSGNEIFTYYLSAQLTSGTNIPIDSIVVQSADPGGISLINNAPNPFNKSTRITFELNKSQKISLKIYNIQGQLVKILIDKQDFPAQYHHITWDASNDYGQAVSSGVYYLRLTAEGHISELKLLYLK